MFSNFSCVSVSHSGFDLYALGNLDLLDSKCISVSGTRKIDSKSSEWLKSILSQISNHTIVSGLALGTDSIAHRTALDLGLPTIAVLPSGFNKITPKSNIKLAKEILDNDGLLISEYSPNSYVKKHQYIARNRIIASLGSFLIVPQFNTHSGTRHTIDFARDYNKTIVIQSAQYSGNQFIIKDNSYHTIIK